MVIIQLFGRVRFICLSHFFDCYRFVKKENTKFIEANQNIDIQYITLQKRYNINQENQSVCNIIFRY